MKGRVINVLFALALTVGVFAGTIAFGSAEEPEQVDSNVVLFPWVPNNSTIDDPREDFGENGPFYGTIAVQNLEDEEIVLYYSPTDDPDYDDLTEWGSTTLDAHATVTLSAETIGVDEPGGGVVVQGLIENGTDEPARIAAVQRQAAGAELTTAVTTSEHNTVSGYSGLYTEEIGPDAILPIAQINDNWNTIIHITNFDEESATDVSVQFNPADGTGWSSTFTFSGDDALEPGETGTIDLLETNAPTDWVGSATISADTNVAAVAERAKNEDDMLIMNVSQNPAVHGGTQSAPLIFNEWFLWNTGISIANLSNSSNHVTITYYDLDGEHQQTGTLDLPPNGMDFVYRPASLGDDNGAEGFVGSAVIRSDAPIIGSVDEVKYFGREDDEDIGHSMSYMVELNAAEAGESLAMPLVQRDSGIDSDGDTTGIQINNPTDESVTVALWYIDDDGEPFSGSPEIIELDANEGHTSYTLDVEDFPTTFQGSAIVQVIAGDGGVTAVANNVNYGVVNDGSSTYNLFRTSMAGPLVEWDDLVKGLSLIADPSGPDEGETFLLTAQLEDDDGNPWYLPGIEIEFEIEFDNGENAGLHIVGDPSDPDSTLTVGTNALGIAQVEATRDDLDEEDDWLPLDATVTATVVDTEIEAEVEITWIAPVEENGEEENGNGDADNGENGSDGDGTGGNGNGDTDNGLVNDDAS